MAAKIKAAPTKKPSERYPIVDLDLAFSGIEDCIAVLGTVSGLLAEDELIDVARVSAQILGYVARDLKDLMVRCQASLDSARHEHHALKYPNAAAAA